MVFKKKPIPLKAFLSDLAKVIFITKSIHKSGYMHGDLKPDNIIKNKKGELTFVDYSSSLNLKNKNQVLDIPETYPGDYSAPELMNLMNYISERYFEDEDISLLEIYEENAFKRIHKKIGPHSEVYSIGRMIIDYSEKSPLQQKHKKELLSLGQRMSHENPEKRLSLEQALKEIKKLRALPVN